MQEVRLDTAGGRAACTALLTIALGAALAAQQPQFAATSTEVDVAVIALDKHNQPIQDLPAAAFELWDNGQLQRLLSVETAQRPLSLAIVVDTSDPNAIGQAARSAELMTAMVIGDSGQASIFVGGGDPQQLVPFTRDHDALSRALKHLRPPPSAPQGRGDVQEPMIMAAAALRKQPATDTRAILVITRSSPRNGEFVQALVEGAASDAMPIFQIEPRRPASQGETINPLSPDASGAGAGSQRAPHTISPVGTGGAVTETLPAGGADINPAGIVAAASGLFHPRSVDYNYDSGGMRYNPGSDEAFDEDLVLMGGELRAVHHLYFRPDDLTATPALHSIVVAVKPGEGVPPLGAIAYRRTYLGVLQH